MLEKAIALGLIVEKENKLLKKMKSKEGRAFQKGLGIGAGTVMGGIGVSRLIADKLRQSKD